jgi:hypothetical protein
MEYVNLTEQLRFNDRQAVLLIKNLFKEVNITELDISNSNEEYDDVYAYCFNDDGLTADNVKLNKIVLDDDTLIFIDENNFSHHFLDFHNGSMPYIYNAVYNIVKDMINAETYDVHIYYHGCFSTTVKASNKDEAYAIALEEVGKLSDLEFLDAIELQVNGSDVDKVERVLD